MKIITKSKPRVQVKNVRQSFPLPPGQNQIPQDLIDWSYEKYGIPGEVPYVTGGRQDFYGPELIWTWYEIEVDE